MDDDRQFTQEDMAKNKTPAAVGYLVFFVPLIFCPDSRLGRYCANQGLIVMIVHILLGMLFSILGGIPLVGWLFQLIGRLAALAVMVVSLLCMLQLMTNDKAVELPYIGSFRILR